MTSTPDPDAVEPVEQVDPAAVTETVTDASATTDAETTSGASTETDASAESTTTDASAESSEPAPVVAQPEAEPTTPTAEELALALAALDEVAPKGAVGEVQDALAEGGAAGQAQVVAIRHVSTLSGYPDWSWTVLLSRGLEGGPTVLEVALLPGQGSLLAPAWVPWDDRLADYLAAKDAASADEGDEDEDDEELDSDLEADLDDDFDDDFDVEADVEEDDDAEWDDEADAGSGDARN